MRSGESSVGMKMGYTESSLKRPRSGGRRWRARKRRRKAAEERRRRQRVQTREARGREDGCGGRRRRISERRSSLSSGCGGAGDGEVDISVCRKVGFLSVLYRCKVTP
jgi:hypothetical protein